MSETHDLVSAFTPDIGLAKVHELSRRWRKLPAHAKSEALKRPLRLALLANHSTQFLARGLELALARRGCLPEVYEAGFGQWEQELVDPAAGWLAFAPDIVLLSLSSPLLAFRADDPTVLAQRIADHVRLASSRCQTIFGVTLPDPMEEEQDPTSWAAEWRRQLSASLREHLPTECLLLDLAPLVIRIGAANWYSGRFVVNGKFACNPERTAALSDYVAGWLAAAVRRPIKLVITDLDNTLWGGIVGEVGWQGLELDLDGAGYPHIRLQRFLLDLHRKGVVLAIASKNDPATALEVFERRPEMLLKRDHFAAWRIGWEPKSKGVAEILGQLNLSSEGVAFIDDSDHERAEVSQAFPELIVPDVSRDLVDLVPRLAESGAFCIPVVSAEDRGRQRAYQDEAERLRVKAASTDLSEYYRSLEMVLTPEPIGPSNDHRVLDLIGKTNQFNLTTRRHGRAALHEFLASDENFCFAYRLRDRHGEYGLISVILAVPEQDAYRIDTWLMSCRVMGRAVERGLFEHLRRFVALKGRRRIVGEYLPTPKNGPVAGLLPDLGFVPGDGGMFEYIVGTNEVPDQFVSIQ